MTEPLWQRDASGGYPADPVAEAERPPGQGSAPDGRPAGYPDAGSPAPAPPLELLDADGSAPTGTGLVEVVPDGVPHPTDDDGLARPPELGIAASIEALLFVADHPVPPASVATALGITARQAHRALRALGDSLRESGRGLRLQLGPQGAQLVTAPQAAVDVEYFLGLEAKRQLSKAALETLAIVAYRQPVVRHVIDTIRGVDSAGAIATLRARDLVEPVGRAPGPGRPILLSTTQRFLEHFGLEHPRDLPALPDVIHIPEPDGEQLHLGGAASAPRASGTVQANGTPPPAGTVVLEVDDAAAGS